MTDDELREFVRAEIRGSPTDRMARQGGVLRLAATGTARRIAFGTDQYTIINANQRSQILTVTHGLGTTPASVVCTVIAANAAGSGGFTNISSWTSTTFDTWMKWDSVVGATINVGFCWVAIG